MHRTGILIINARHGNHYALIVKDISPKHAKSNNANHKKIKNESEKIERDTDRSIKLTEMKHLTDERNYQTMTIEIDGIGREFIIGTGCNDPARAGNKESKTTIVK